MVGVHAVAQLAAEELEAEDGEDDEEEEGDEDERAHRGHRGDVRLDGDLEVLVARDQAERPQRAERAQWLGGR